MIVISGSTLGSDGSFQPLAVESMAKWTRTRPIVLGEEAVPWNPRTASATGAAATVASRVPMSFEDVRRPFEGSPTMFLELGCVVRSTVLRKEPTA